MAIGSALPTSGINTLSLASPLLSTTDEVEEVEKDHPKKSTITPEISPSYSLCERTYVAHQRQMRVVLLPSLKNVVRHLVTEFAVPEGRRENPAVRAARMSMEELLRIGREERVWFDGISWAERRRGDDAVNRRKRVQFARQDALRREDDSASSSGSSSTKSASDGSSSATSPVLSTTTLQTMPSPPPLSDEGVDVRKKQDYFRPMTILVFPVLDPPRLFRPMLYAPVTKANMPHYGLEAFKAASFYVIIFPSSFLLTRTFY